MTVRRTKQLIYGAIYLLIVIGIVVGAYYRFFWVAPSCFDHIQNQGETGVDCGGPCAKVCAPTEETIVVGDLRAFASSPGHDTFLARIENHNPGLAARSFGYELDLVDASGAVLQSFFGNSFLYSGEVKYVVVPNVAVAGAFDHAALTVQNPDWIPAAQMGLIPQFGNPLPVTGNTVTSSTLTVTSALTDSDIAAFKNIVIVAIFYSVNGIPIGASETELDAIAPNQTEQIAVSYPAVPNINPLLTKIYAYALRT
jgi:hypothetical protein